MRHFSGTTHLIIFMAFWLCFMVRMNFPLECTQNTSYFIEISAIDGIKIEYIDGNQGFIGVFEGFDALLISNIPFSRPGFTVTYIKPISMKCLASLL